MSKLLDSIPANQNILMTEELIRTFKIAGCDPAACHCCLEKIISGDVFKLEMIKTQGAYAHEATFNDEMLCKDCTADMLTRQRKKERRTKLKEENYLIPGGYSREHI